MTLNNSLAVELTVGGLGFIVSALIHAIVSEINFGICQTKFQTLLSVNSATRLLFSIIDQHFPKSTLIYLLLMVLYN